MNTRYECTTWCVLFFLCVEVCVLKSWVWDRVRTCCYLAFLRSTVSIYYPWTWFVNTDVQDDAHVHGPCRRTVNTAYEHVAMVGLCFFEHGPSTRVVWSRTPGHTPPPEYGPSKWPVFTGVWTGVCEHGPSTQVSIMTPVSTGRVGPGSVYRP